MTESPSNLTFVPRPIARVGRVPTLRKTGLFRTRLCKPTCTESRSVEGSDPYWSYGKLVCRSNQSDLRRHLRYITKTFRESVR